MPAKGSSKNERYIGVDERGYSLWRAECGHPTLGRNAKRCQSCHNKNRAVPNYLGFIEGRQLYTAKCGHPAKRRDAKRCRACVAKTALSKDREYSKGYYAVVYRKGEKGKQRRVHIEKAEAVLGRPLKKGEVVHHINMDKHDNRNCNLLVCTRKYHMELHHRMQLRYAATCVARLIDN